MAKKQETQTVTRKAQPTAPPPVQWTGTVEEQYNRARTQVHCTVGDQAVILWRNRHRIDIVRDSVTSIKSAMYLSNRRLGNQLKLVGGDGHPFWQRCQYLQNTVVSIGEKTWFLDGGIGNAIYSTNPAYSSGWMAKPEYLHILLWALPWLSGEKKIEFYDQVYPGARFPSPP